MYLKGYCNYFHITVALKSLYSKKKKPDFRFNLIGIEFKVEAVL